MPPFTGLPHEIWGLIIEAAAEWYPPDTYPQLKRNGVLTAWSHAPQDHPLIALSQTCKTLQRTAAPIIWSDIQLGNQTWFYDVEQLPKLISRLNSPIARVNIRSLDLNLKTDTVRSGHEYDYWDGPPLAPKYPDLLALFTRLGEVLKGTTLRNLRLHPDSIHPSDDFLIAIGNGCQHLQHIELGYGCDQLPFGQRMNNVIINGPDQLDRLTQVCSATIGMGALQADDELRDPVEPGEMYWVEERAPGLIKWLRGELPDGSSSGQEDNKLVFLKTSASFLYRYRSLAPAWARFNEILERIDETNAAIAPSFATGDGVDFDREPGGELYDEEVSWVHAAAAIRPSLDHLVASCPERNIEALDVVDMVRSDPIFGPWRSAWFSGVDWDESSGPSTRALSLADEILHHWRKSAQSRREAPVPPARWTTGW